MSPFRCLIVDDDAMSRTVLEEYVALCADLTLYGSCADAVEASNLMGRDVPDAILPDAILLDVEMPHMTGLEFIGSISDPPPIILVSGNEGYALDAFDADVVDYLLKPVTYGRFLKAIDRLKKRTNRSADSGDTVFIKSDGRLVRLELDAVLYLEAERDYVLIHTAGGKHVVLSTMKSMQEKLPPKDFLRVHRSYIVRFDRIEDIQDQSLVIGKSVIPIGASYREALQSRLRML